MPNRHRYLDGVPDLTGKGSATLVAQMDDRLAKVAKPVRWHYETLENKCVLDEAQAVFLVVGELQREHLNCVLNKVLCGLAI